jgi:hypothetical protein
MKMLKPAMILFRNCKFGIKIGRKRNLVDLDLSIVSISETPYCGSYELVCETPYCGSYEHISETPYCGSYDHVSEIPNCGFVVP